MAFGAMLRRVLQIIFKCCCCCFSRKDTQDTENHEINEVGIGLGKQKNQKSTAKENDIDIEKELEKADFSQDHQIIFSLNQLRDGGGWSTTEDEDGSVNDERTADERTSLRSKSKSKKNRNRQLSSGTAVPDGKFKLSKKEKKHIRNASQLPKHRSSTNFKDFDEDNVDIYSDKKDEYFGLLNTEEKLVKFCSSPCGETINQTSSTISGDCTLIAERSLDHHNTDNCFYNQQPLEGTYTHKSNVIYPEERETFDAPGYPQSLEGICTDATNVIYPEGHETFDALGNEENEFVEMEIQPPCNIANLDGLTTLWSPNKNNDLENDPQQVIIPYGKTNVLDIACRDIPEPTSTVEEEIIFNENVSPLEECLILDDLYNFDIIAKINQPEIEAVDDSDPIPSSLFRRNRSDIPYKERNRQAAKLYRENKNKEKELKAQLAIKEKEVELTKQKSQNLEKSCDGNTDVFVDACMERAENEDQAVNIFSNLVMAHLQNVITRESTDDKAAEIALYRDRIMPTLKRKYPNVYTRVQLLWVGN